ncbi:MAG TPA: permease [Planctomycetes bacterium]|nr:permease [Planctomycetota bacterium]
MAWLAEIWSLLCTSGPYLLVGFFIAGLLKVLVPERWILRHLGSNSFGAVAKAALVGAPLPLCSCSVVPTAISLKQAGASKGATSAFLISTPETGVDSVGITLALIDPVMAIMRPVTAILTAMGCGWVVNLSEPKTTSELAEDEAPDPPKTCCAPSDPEPAPTPSTTCCASGPAEPEPAPTACCDTEAQASSQPSRLRQAGVFAYGKLMSDLAPWFVVGFALSAAITLWMPNDFLGSWNHGLPAMLAMLVAGIPMYVCATASTPVAAALLAKGLDPGAALVFLLAGPATNAATLGVVAGFMGRRVVGVYLASITVFSLCAGWAVNALYDARGGFESSTILTQHEHLSALHRIGGALLGLLLLGHVIAILARRGASPPDPNPAS